MSGPAQDLTAFSDGRLARTEDDENATLTDNPYTQGTGAHNSWYRGYNYDDENPEVLEEIRAFRATGRAQN